jgi:glycine/D-amino acid oxidase-like deaminating enzyme/nitrite reductase/ring-hydroxylating ferredoxin subunit
MAEPRPRPQTSSTTPWGELPRPGNPLVLDGDLTADVCVVGAGIAGLSVAYQVAREGRRVVVVERDEIGSGDSGVTTAHLASALDERFVVLERTFGVEGARLAYESHQAAIEAIGRTVAEEGIACGYARVDGYLFLGPGDEPELLEREAAAARRAGFLDVELLAGAPGAPFDTGPCLRFPRQGRLQPLAYLAGLARAVERLGGRIATGARVVEIAGGRRGYARTEGGARVHAEHLVVATNAPSNDLLVVNSQQEPYRTYAIAGPVPAGSVPDALWWDTEDPYHYVRLHREPSGREVLIVGGEDHRTGEDYRGGVRHRRLEDWARRRFGLEAVEHRWSGQVMEPYDGLGFIGRNPLDAGNVYVASGDSGHGMTHGTIAGLLIADLVAGRDNPWQRLYDPSRINLAAFGEQVRIGADIAGRYARWLVPREGEVSSFDEVAAGEGRIVRRLGLPVAAYRDPGGRLHTFAAACTHLACPVRWNDVERSWDCPCHGSRFAATGEVLHGPAKTPLVRWRA